MSDRKMYFKSYMGEIRGQRPILYRGYAVRRYKDLLIIGVRDTNARNINTKR